MQEEFKDVEGYEGLYQISNLGRVKSLNYNKERILKSAKDTNGYLIVGLSENNILKTKKVHKLVAIAFLNHIPDGTTKLVIDHINNNKSDNCLENLQIITHRKNVSKDLKNKTSKYTGVSWVKKSKKWRSKIYINGKQTHLGYFINELEASNAYNNKLNELQLC